jgi:hypothetical protein
MPYRRAARLFLLSIAPILLAGSLASSQTPQPAQPSGPAQISVEEEGHHHLVFQNAYVKVLYVEIPAHESTLYHRHDLPYVSFPPPPLADAPPSQSPNGRSLPSGPHVSYAAGGFSHAMKNPSDVALRNIAIELLRPQGPVRNRCAEVLRGQPLTDCDKPAASSTTFPIHYTLFETDEIAVEDWEIAPGSTINPADARVSTLVGGFAGIADVTGGGDSRMVPKAGVMWLLAGSKATITAAPDASGHFVMIRFKDSVRPESAQ